MDSLNKLVNDYHKDIRGLIKGETWSKKIVVPEIIRPAEDASYRKLRNQLVKLLKDKLPEEVYNEKIKPLDFRYKLTPAGDKIGKIVNFELRKDSESAKTAGLILSKLGERWAECTTKNLECEIILDTTADAFLRLGHYGCDVDSCFKDTSEKEYQRQNVAILDNSFVFLLKRENEYIARTWGWFNEYLINFCNLYTKKAYPGSIFYCMENVANTLLEEKTACTRNIVTSNKKVIWVNKETWTFHRPGMIPPKQRIKIN